VRFLLGLIVGFATGFAVASLLAQQGVDAETLLKRVSGEERPQTQA
jgi:hypothetical protein